MAIVSNKSPFLTSLMLNNLSQMLCWLLSKDIFLLVYTSINSYIPQMLLDDDIDRYSSWPEQYDRYRWVHIHLLHKHTTLLYTQTVWFRCLCVKVYSGCSTALAEQILQPNCNSRPYFILFMWVILVNGQSYTMKRCAFQPSSFHDF